MRYFPVFLDLTNKPVIVIGGGKIAFEKVHTLLESGAQITIVAPEISPQLFELVESGKIFWKRREYNQSDLTDAFLVIAATGKVDHSKEIFSLVSEKQRLVNSVDDPLRCNFIFPAIARSGPLQIAVSSSGSSPALAQRLRDQIRDQILTLETGELARFLGDRRSIVKTVFSRYLDRELFWNAVIDSEIPELISQGKNEQANNLFLAMLGYYSNTETVVN